MSLSPQFLDELRARTSLSRLIARHTKLQRAGHGEWKACCPFHKERTPSFTVSDDKGFYHCFGCGAHGDAIRWLTDARGLGFMDAVKELADAVGMSVPAPDPRAQAKAERAAGLHAVTEAAATWFAEQLDGSGGEAARDYLEQRGIDRAARLRFNFGFAPDSRTALRTALKQFGDKALGEVGLLVAPEEDRRDPYDRFRGRLMIPIRDVRGRVIGFGGRILGPGEPKYLNSPEGPLFDKGRTLYNLDQAGPASREAKRVIVVEGYMDVIALDQAGVSEVVAPLGTALTEAQLGLLWRLSNEPYLCFDGDVAGQKAAFRAALRALPAIAPGRSLTFVTIPPGQDPDDLVRNSGRQALEALLSSAEPLVDRLWNHELGAAPLKTPEQRAGLKQRLLEHAGAIGDGDVREQYRSEFLRRFSALGARREPRRGKWVGPRGRFAPPERPTSAQAHQVGRAGLDPELGKAVLSGLARFPDLIGEHADALNGLAMPDRRAARLRDLMVEAAMTHPQLDRERLDTILAAKGEADLLEGMNPKRGLAFSFTRRDAGPERARRDLILVIETLAARPGLVAALEAATARLKEATDETAFREQQRLLKAREEADRQLATLIEGQGD